MKTRIEVMRCRAGRSAVAAVAETRGFQPKQV
jgi:hypothetical protein